MVATVVNMSVIYVTCNASNALRMEIDVRAIQSKLYRTVGNMVLSCTDFKSKILWRFQGGVFATVDFVPGVVIIDHPYGELKSGRAINRRYGNVDNPFVIPTSRMDKFWDDTCSRGLMGYVQDNSDVTAMHGGPYNTRYDMRGTKVTLVTVHGIFAGDELLVDKGLDLNSVNMGTTRTLWRANSRKSNRFSRADDKYGDTLHELRLPA